jgi:hypothetical protein
VRHDPASRTRYQDLKQLARSRRRVLAGTPGTLTARTQAGKRYWVREYLRADGAKVDEYLGAEASVGEARVAALRGEIELAKALAAGSSTLRVFGFQRVGRRVAAVLEVLFNHGLFQAGLTLVGSHAYGALLNELGVLAPGYRTQDLDVARARPLATALSEAMSFGRLLGETGLRFTAVPGMPSHRPSASFKLPGAEALTVDLLVPGARAGDVLPVPELRAHAQAIPLLDYLLRDTVEAVVLSPNQVIPVRLPSPERFVAHKLYASQSRRADRDKVRKDLEQAAVLAAVLAEDTPGALGKASRRMPAAGRSAMKRGARVAARLLEDAHPAGAAALERLASA